MSNYSLLIIVLEGCGYSKAAIDFLEPYNIKKKFINIKYDEKDKYKTSSIQTFPQIYLKKNKSTLLLGGYEDLVEAFNMFYKKYNKQDIITFKKNNLDWSEKSKLRLIELINS